MWQNFQGSIPLTSRHSAYTQFSPSYAPDRVALIITRSLMTRPNSVHFHTIMLFSSHNLAHSELLHQTKYIMLLLEPRGLSNDSLAKYEIWISIHVHNWYQIYYFSHLPKKLNLYKLIINLWHQNCLKCFELLKNVNDIILSKKKNLARSCYVTTMFS